MDVRVGSLFSGIGGLDLGLERAGGRVVWQSEIDPYCCRVLAKHWPHVPNLGDITTIDWSQVEPVDIICGGYPCQPFSLAGVRRGEDDARHLWPYFADAIRVLRPRYALLENVPGHLSLGFGRVLGDLAELGFDAEWDCIPAAALGAPHLRYRIFVVAHATQRDGGRTVGGLRSANETITESETGASRWNRSRSDVVGDCGALSDANGGGFEERSQRDGRQATGIQSPLGHDVGRLRADVADADPGGWDGWPWLIGSRRRGEPTDGGWWATEPDVGRVAHGVPARVDRLRALGNAVVPQVAEWVGRRIMAAAA